QSDCDGERTDLLGLADLLRDLHPRERIANANVHTDQPLELTGQAGQVRGATRQHDLADAERAGLVLVVLERGNELARERLNRSAHRVARALRLFGSQTLRHHLIRQRAPTLRAPDPGPRSDRGARTPDARSEAPPFHAAAVAARGVVGHGFVDRAWPRRLRADTNRIRELLLVLDAGDLEGADTDPVVRKAEPNALLGQAVLREEVLERLGERFGIAQLPADDDARGERLTRDLQQLCRAVVRDTRRGKLRGADLHADDTT